MTKEHFLFFILGVDPEWSPRRLAFPYFSMGLIQKKLRKKLRSAGIEPATPQLQIGEPTTMPRSLIKNGAQQVSLVDGRGMNPPM